MVDLDELDDPEPLRRLAAPWGTTATLGADLPQASAEPVDLAPAVVDSWRDLAACAGLPVDWWYATIDVDRDAYHRARAICATCPVAIDCIAHAVTWPERYGTWGGLSPKHVARLRSATSEPQRWRIGEPGRPPRGVAA